MTATMGFKYDAAEIQHKLGDVTDGRTDGWLPGSSVASDLSLPLAESGSTVGVVRALAQSHDNEHNGGR